MKYIKTFEEVDIDKPKIGDYTVAEIKKADSKLPMAINNAINNQIGTIVDIVKDDLEVKYRIKYNKKVISKLFDFYKKINRTPPSYFSDTFSLDQTDIKYFSPNKKDLEMYIMADKYNL